MKGCTLLETVWYRAYTYRAVGLQEAIDVLLDDWEIVPSEERRSTSASTSRSRSRISLAPNRDSLNSRGKGSKRPEGVGDDQKVAFGTEHLENC